MKKPWSVTQPLLYRGDVSKKLLQTLAALHFQQVGEDACLLQGKIGLDDVVAVVDFGPNTENCTVLVITVASEFYPYSLTGCSKLPSIEQVVSDLSALSASFNLYEVPMDKAPADLIAESEPRCPFTRFGTGAIIKAAQACRKLFG